MCPPQINVCLLVEAEWGQAAGWAAPLLLGSWPRGRALGAARVQVQGPRQRITHLPGCSWVLLGSGLPSPPRCPVAATLTFFGQYARVCTHKEPGQVHLFIILAERQIQRSVRGCGCRHIHNPTYTPHANYTSEAEQRP